MGLRTGAGVSQGSACMCVSEEARAQASYTRGCPGAGHSPHLCPQELPPAPCFSLAPQSHPRLQVVCVR